MSKRPQGGDPKGVEVHGQLTEVYYADDAGGEAH